MTFTKERRIRPHCSFVSSLYSRVFFACAILNERKRSDSKPPNRLKRVAFFVRDLSFCRLFLNPNSIKTLTFLPPCFFAYFFKQSFASLKKMRTLFQSDKAHVFLFPHHLHAERERETARARETGHTHTHARTSAAEALFCVGYLVFYNNAQRERKRERQRD